MYIRDIIRKKRKKEILTEEEIRFFIFGYFKDEISEAQASAVLTAMYIYGISEKELMHMIIAIAETGEELEIYRASNKIVDLGQNKVYEFSELGMEDRLLSLSDYKIESNLDMFKENIKNDNIAILKSLKKLAPVEEKLYRLRHEIACESNIDLIASSIMS